MNVCFGCMHCFAFDHHCVCALTDKRIEDNPMKYRPEWCPLREVKE